MRWMLILTVLATLALTPPAGAEALNGRRLDHHPGHGPRVIVVPTPVYLIPSQCRAQGYWTYAWVPQVSSYSVWVPAGWSPGGYWIDGHYEQQVSSSGYWQPYWVEGGWGAC